MQQPNVIAITSIGNTNQRDRVAAPPSVPETRVGFNNILIDPDGRVRRNLMSASNGKRGLASFSLQLALMYLKDRGISGKLTEAWGELMLKGRDNPVEVYRVIRSHF